MFKVSCCPYVGGRMEFVLLLLAFVAARNSSLASFFFFSGSPFCQETEQSSIKSNFGGTVIGNYA